MNCHPVVVVGVLYMGRYFTICATWTVEGIPFNAPSKWYSRRDGSQGNLDNSPCGHDVVRA